MIEVTFKPNEMKLTVGGHAEYDEKGKDIICAAVSILFYTLSDSLKKSEMMLKKNSLVTEVGDKESSISCRPLKKFEPNIETIYWVVLNGIQMLADEYKDYVKLTIKEGE